MLFASLRRTFVVNKQFTRKLDNLSSKIRTRKSVADMAKLQGLLDDSLQKSTLKEKISKSANMDAQFNDFLKKFKSQNQEYANILDFTRFFDENNQLRNEEKMRQDEIDMLKEFQKRTEERKDHLKKEVQQVDRRKKSWGTTSSQASTSRTATTRSTHSTTRRTTGSCTSSWTRA